jgi:cellulose 1,4-beta-cellobiosidase
MKIGAGAAEGVNLWRIKAGAVCMLISLIVPFYTARAVELCDGSWNYAMGGEYRVMNNIWGSCPGVGEQCIDADPLSTYFKVISSTHTGGCVASYPAVYKGCNFGACSIDSGLPVRVRTIQNAPFSWDVNTAGATGTWNVSMDVWFSPNGGGSQSAELMIWINANGGASPGGSYVGTVSIGGASWWVYYAPKGGGWNWNYIAYRKASSTSSLNLDLKAFIDDSVNRGYISNLWYLEAIEAGFEIWSYGTGLTNNSFLTSVTAGPDNNAPAVSITSPSTGDTFNQAANITINASASDTDGSVTKVEFYQGSTKLGEDTSAPYSYTWNNVPTSYYKLTARATDNIGDSTTSSGVNIHVIGGSGAILREWWTGIAGTAVNDLTSDANFPAKPSGRELITTLEGPTNWADNYGTRIRGYLWPISNGDYTFWIASDANSQLWLATDDNPANVSLIVRAPEQTESSPISLAVGGKYYIEVLHKAGLGDDNLAVAWGVAPNQDVIEGMYLSPCCLKSGDFARFAAQWRKTNCTAVNGWCGGADFNHDGSVLLGDLKEFAGGWLDLIE